MSNLDGIRISAALIFSLSVHVVLMSMDFGGGAVHVSQSPQRKVEVRLVARRIPPVAKPEVVTKKKERKTSVSKKMVPVLERPVQVAVREIPPVALPTAPVVPEPEATPDASEPGAESVAEPAPMREPVVEVGGAPGKPLISLARPLYRENPRPEYPSRARRRHLQGTVILEVSVTRDGRVDELRVKESSGHEILDRAALRAVKSWLFEPGRRGRERIAMSVLVPVRFDLR